MRVRIVSYEDVNAWILGKFARKMEEELLKLGVKVDIGNEPDPAADINHHIIYLDYKPVKSSAIDTLMITHIDNQAKLQLIKEQLNVARLGICMSADTMKLLGDFGISHQKICYVNPAHDGVIKSRKFSVGLSFKIHADGRKREQLLVKVTDNVSADDFKFVIMGEGWEDIILNMRSKGFEVEYFPGFDYAKYVELVPTFDYFMYMGQDEGAMSYTDALSAGVKTIVTPQGYHLDAPGGITHAFNTGEELVAVFKKIAEEKTQRINAVRTWTWEHYAIKHLDLWNYLLSGTVQTRDYPDGLNSLLSNSHIAGVSFRSQWKTKYKIFKITLSRFLHSKDKWNKIKRKITSKLS
jgi:hypothetical protein